MHLRHATLHDLPQIVAIYNSTVPGRMVTADTEPVTVESRLPWFESHHPHTRPLLVAEQEQQVVGFLSFRSFYGRPAYQSTAEISIYLHPQHRHQGLGKQLLQEAVERSPKLAVKTLLAFIFGHNEPSLQLFRKFGFEQWALLPRVAELDGIERDLVILGRRVVS